MRIRGIGTAKRIAGWARSLVHRGPVILGYHQVATSDWDPQKLCVSPENFAEQLEIMSRVAKPISLAQLSCGLQEGEKLEKSFVVTIDDGYADTLEAATPILERFGVPATVFITTGVIGKPFWWCEIQHLVQESTTLPPIIEINAGDHTLNWRRTSDSRKARAKLIQTLGDLFRALPFDQQDETLKRVRALFSANGASSGIRAMTAEQIASLSSSGLIEIGSHAVTHTSLNQLGVEQQRIELQQSKQELERICGKPVVSCSYPNGRISAETSEVARELGYTSGCTSQEELVASNCDPLLLPRLWVGDWDGDRFSRWLKWWLR